MKRTRRTPEQIVAKLREADGLRAATADDENTWIWHQSAPAPESCTR